MFYIISKSILNSILLQRSIVYISLPKTNKKPRSLSDLTLFEYLIVNFNIIKTSNSFQYYINHILFDFFNKFYTINFNNILIYNKS